MKKLTEEQTNLMLNIEYLAKQGGGDCIYEGILTHEIDNEYIAHKRFPTLLAALQKKGYIEITKEVGSNDSIINILPLT